MSTTNNSTDAGSKATLDAKNPCPFLRALQALGYIDSFAADFEDESGTLERGFDEAALNRMMDENFARPSDRRRWFDRLLMNGEWPALLQVMGKTHLSEPYLSLFEVKDLFVNRRLPERVTKRLPPHK